MKKKSANKSKDRDKSKTDESKSHKHSRRKRKSSSSGSDSESVETRNEITDEIKTRRSAAAKKEFENNVTTTRITTRHSKRLAAINASSDEIKEELLEISSPIKTGKSSPFSGECKGSPSKEKKRDASTPDKHRTKDSEVWKVKSANGAGAGELQKLKICRQRSPEPTTTGPQTNKAEAIETEVETVETNNTCENEVVHEQTAFPVNDEDIANIQLPSDDIQPIADIQLPSDGIQLPLANIQLPSDQIEPPIANIQLPSDDIQPPAIEEIPIPEEKIPTEPISYETCSKEIKSNVIPEEDVSQICLPADEPKQPVQFIEEPASVPIEPRVEPIQLLVEQKRSEVVKTAEEPVTEVTEIVEPEEPKIEEPAHLEEPQPEEPPATEVSQPSPSENVEPDKVAEEVPESIELPVTSSPRISESEDNQQTEIVLTVEDNAMEETVEILAEPETLVEAADEKPAIDEPKEERLNKTVEQEEMEEMYDYEHDDVKEEGELSANESVSPIHEVFKRYPVGERKRSWGQCNVFRFDRFSVVGSESALKECNVKKRIVSKEELDTSDPEDLIFVKEIREENIVHEIESETNNTFVDKDDDDVVSLSPKYEDEKETKKKRLSESDRKKSHPRDRLSEDKPERKRIVKEAKSQSSDGRTVLYITNLVRPFTINQLRELLQRTGKIVDDGFWIDSIKSKCYVQFETEDEALETRHALHGIRWPVNNPKVLSVHFATQDDLLSAQAQTHESEIPRKTEPLVVENHAEQKRGGIDWKKHFEQYDERPVRKVKDVREWDIGKPAHPDEMVYAEPEDSRRIKEDPDKAKKLRKDRRRRNGASDDETTSRKQRKTANESGQAPAEAKLLDDLFRRTKASPSIYWLPLSEEQIAVKQEARKKHLEDLDKQLKKRDGEGDRRRDRRRSRR